MVVVVFLSSRDLLSRVALPNVFIGACENMDRKETVRFTIPLVLLYIRGALPILCNETAARPSFEASI